MPYIILLIGLIIGVAGLYRFLIKANIQEIKALITATLILTLCVALFYLSITGRLPAAIAIISALAPFYIGWLANKRAKNSNNTDRQNSNSSMTREDALDILGLDANASDDDIKTAYKKLMKKVHPDQEGSEWMASKLNAAKDFLIHEKD